MTTSTALVESRFRAASIACGAIVAVMGLSALLGWIVGSEALKGSFAGINIKTNTALCLLSAGLSLILLEPEQAGTLRVRIGQGFAVLIVLIGLATLSEHLFGWDLGIDQALFKEGPGVPATQSPNRMGPPASICFPLLGIGLLLLPRGAEPRMAHQRFAVAAIVIATLPLLGYVFEVSALYGIARYTGIALSTAFAFVLLGLGIVWARPEVGAMRQLLADDAGGMLMRRMLPAAIVLPVLLGWLRVKGQDAGFYDVTFGRSLLILSFMLVFSTLVWLTGRTVARHARARVRAEAAEGRLKDQLLESLERERTARATAEQSNLMKDEFLATLSHELRTPLQAILGWTHLLRHGGTSPDDVQRGLEAVERNARIQAQLVEDLLDMSRIVSGKIGLDLQDVDLEHVIENALSAAAPAAEAKQVRTERSFDGARATVRGDPARLQQVLGNLVSNAIKFTPEGGRVLVSLRNLGTHVDLSVEDTGIGLAPEMLGQIFDRFRQADGSTKRRHGGLGLGLSIARQLTELHGGSLHARSEGAGRGAAFVVRLPLATPRSLGPIIGTPPVFLTPEVTGDPTAPLDDIRVLVVDDQPDACELIERVLCDRHADVTTAGGVEMALAALERGRFDILISDIGMPGRDGFDLIHELRNRAIVLPAIALTAFARAEDRQTILAAGYQIHLTKPVDPARLVAAVASLAGRANGGEGDGPGRDGGGGGPGAAGGRAARTRGVDAPRSPDAVQRSGDGSASS